MSKKYLDENGLAELNKIFSQKFAEKGDKVVIEVGSGQVTFFTKVFPKIPIDIAKNIYDTYISGSVVIIRWKVMNAIPVEATVLGSDYVNGYKSFNFIMHDTYAVEYKYTDSTTGYAETSVIDLKAIKDISPSDINGNIKLDGDEVVVYDDSNVVKKSGDTMTGELTVSKLNVGKFTSNATPNYNEIYDLGSSTKGWKNVYVGQRIKMRDGEDENGNPTYANTLFKKGTMVCLDTSDYRTFTPIYVSNGNSGIKFTSENITMGLGCDGSYINDPILTMSDSDFEIRLNGNGFFKIGNGWASLSFSDNEFNLYSGQKINITAINDSATTYGYLKIDSVSTRLTNYDYGLDIHTSGDFNISSSNKINMYVDSGSVFRDPENVNRVKFGGDEIVQENGNAESIYFAAKPANSDNQLVPFAITKDGKGYYKGKELANVGDISNKVDKISGKSKFFNNDGLIGMVSDPDDETQGFFQVSKSGVATFGTETTIVIVNSNGVSFDNGSLYFPDGTSMSSVDDFVTKNEFNSVLGNLETLLGEI